MNVPNLVISTAYNAVTDRPGRLSQDEKERILESFDSQYIPEDLKDGDIVYPRIEGDFIAVYLEPYDTFFYSKGDARCPETGDLIDPWSHVNRSGRR